VRFRVDGSKALFADVCVTLSGRHVAVAKEILYHAKVCPTIEQMRREAVAQGVRVRRTWATTIENAADVAGRQPHSAFVAEQCGARIGRHHLATKATSQAV